MFELSCRSSFEVFNNIDNDTHVESPMGLSADFGNLITIDIGSGESLHIISMTIVFF